MRVRLRPMVRRDLPLLGGWLREPLVAEWWHDDPAPEALERQYGAAIDGDEPTALRVGELAGRPVGFVQWYRLADEPQWLAELRPWVEAPEEAVGLDYLVGAQQDRGHGVGTALVAAALAEIGPGPLVVPVQARNAASVAVLRRNGLVVAGAADLEPDNPAHGRDHVVLVRL